MPFSGYQASVTQSKHAEVLLVELKIPHFEYFVWVDCSARDITRPLSLSKCPTSEKITRDQIWRTERLHSPTYYRYIMNSVRSRHFCEARRYFLPESDGYSNGCRLHQITISEKTGPISQLQSQYTTHQP